MLDSDLAGLYGITTFRLNEAVKRNKNRFPDDFIFRLDSAKRDSLTSQIAMSNKGRGGRRTMPYVFTEQGVAMLSSVLNSDRAVQVNTRDNAGVCKYAAAFGNERRGQKTPC